MRTKLVVSLIPLATLLAGDHLDTDVLSGLNDCIQKRFLDTGSFGINRILPFHGVRQFRPASAQERTAVDGLEEKGYEAALFLAGRQVLGPSNGFDPRSGVQGPAYITRRLETEDLPKPADLLADARAALASFDKGDAYEIEKYGWTVEMRPLRATRETCVQCHTMGSGGKNEHLKIGDALGVVLYVYRPNVMLESAVNLR